MDARLPRPYSATRVDGANRLGSSPASRSYWPLRADVAAWPAPACAAMVSTCGAAMTAATAAPAASALTRARLGTESSQGASASAAMMAAITALSWLTSTEAPMTTPRTRPRRSEGSRRSRIAVSSASGRNTVPMAMLRWYQSCQSSIPDRPNSAPAAIAPVRVGSQSRAARYMA